MFVVEGVHLGISRGRGVRQNFSQYKEVNGRNIPFQTKKGLFVATRQFECISSSGERIVFTIETPLRPFC